MDFNNDHYSPYTEEYHTTLAQSAVIALVTIAASLCLIIIFWLFCKYFSKYFLSPIGNIMRARRQSELGEPGLTTSSQINSSERATTGLDPSVISSLPVLKFRKEEFLLLYKGDMAMECVVCLSVLEYETLVRVLTNCNHFFHVCCIDKWLSSHPTCPICRAEAMPKVKALDHVVVIDSEVALSDDSPQSDDSLQSPIQVNGLESSTIPILRVENVHQENGNGSFDSVLKS